MLKKVFPKQGEDAQRPWRTAKAALTGTLTIAANVLDGLPVPGAKGSINAVLSVIAGIDRTSSNVESLQKLESHVKLIFDVVLEPISKMEPSSVPSGLKADTERLASELESSAAIWKKRKTRGRIRRFIDSGEDEADLRKFLQDISLAVQRFQTSGVARSQLADARREQGITRLEERAEDEEKTTRLLERSKLVNNLPRAHKASFDSGRAGASSSCLEGTRVAILDKIKAWVDNPDPATPRIFWLSGLAGIGKTTIARTIAEFADQGGLLGGSFFFSRDDSDLSSADLVFPTLAFQLAQRNERLKSAIGEVLEEDADYGHRVASIQFEKLVIGPLIAVGTSERTFVVVLDALDECGNERGASEILQLLLALAPRIPFRFRILITSRPEHHIRSVFNQDSSHLQFILHDADASDVRRDIQRYVRTELVDIPRRLQLTIQSPWPEEAVLDTLVDKSGQLFIYAATAIRFIGNDRVRNPQKQISIILGARQSTTAKPYAQLDQLYLQVLRSALPEGTDEDDFDRFHWVVGCIVLLRDKLSMEALGHFTPYRPQEIDDTLYHLHSIILAPSTFQEAPRVYHPSFPDFITDPERCSDKMFAIDVPSQEERLVVRCLEVMMASLKRDIVGIQDLSLLNREVPDLAEKVAQCIPPELQYSCKFWTSHLVRAPLGAEEVTDLLEDFASAYLMWWFEAMSLLDCIPLAVSCMHDAHRWVSDSHCREDIVALFHDAYRFILSHQKLIGSCAMQVYQTALPFTPHDTVLYKTYCKELDHAVHVLQGLPLSWQPFLRTMRQKFLSVVAIAFSPDGLLVATGYEGSKNFPVTIWDAKSGTPVTTLVGHLGGVRSVAFSPDSTRLASASRDKTVRIWHLTARVSAVVIEGHTADVNAVDYLPSGANVVSGSSDCTIRLWNSLSGAIVNTIDTPCSVNALAACPDGARLVSGQADGTVRVFNFARRTRISSSIFEGHTQAVSSVAVSPDGVRVISGSQDCSIRIWDTSSGTCLAALQDFAHPVISVACGLHAWASGSADYAVRMWAKDAFSTADATTLSGHTSWVTCVAFSSDGSRLASGSSDASWRLWDVEAVATQPPKQHASAVSAYGMSRDRSLLVTGNDDGLVNLWDARAGSHLAVLEGHQDQLTSLVFSPDGSKFASRSVHGTVILWDAKDRRRIMTLQERHSDERDFVSMLAFSNDGAHVLDCRSTDTLSWDVNTGAPVDASSIDFDILKADKSAVLDPVGWLLMKAPSGESVRVAQIPLGGYQVSGYGVHGDRMILPCGGGQVLILDISRPLACISASSRLFRT
ncbi:WD40 repeat-like protein [Artomyces pyxidatus]|uniref:WD40 repeat-like protein n=1 Tax=Artomyces pyxidatus TaxID=48021 RepID=A0ACB8T782_9AGAM|nr:WD40 repeat-like protein [Artomyces pyxidatus]